MLQYHVHSEYEYISLGWKPDPNPAADTRRRDGYLRQSLDVYPRPTRSRRHELEHKSTHLAATLCHVKHLLRPEPFTPSCPQRLRSCGRQPHLAPGTVYLWYLRRGRPISLIFCVTGVLSTSA